MTLQQHLRCRPDAARGIGALVLALSLGACTLPPVPGRSVPSVYQQERFQPDETYSRLFDANVRDTCEAARRALLSQGYIISSARTDAIAAAKRFQPEGEVRLSRDGLTVCIAA